MEEESKNLLPTVDVPDFVDEEEDEEYDVDYKPSPMWDLEKGDFVRTAANNVPMNDGYEAYKIWCVKTVSTERYSCLGYSDDHGTETEDITRESDQSTVELSLERTIQEALMVNPRTSSVEEFSFEWNACSSVMIHSNVFRYFVTSNRIMIDKCYHKEVENVVFRYFWSNI